MHYTFFKTILICFGLFSWTGILAQCKDQVTHSEGTEQVRSTEVKIEKKGHATLLPDYCSETTPYHIGYSFEDGYSYDGSYLFTFDPPISMARLNFSGISNVVGSTEEVSIWVNGLHYVIKEAGDPNGCDDMAIVTQEGNIGVPKHTLVGGWLGTIIEGPIKTLEVKDSVIKGHPSGALFSLFICEGIEVYLGPDTAICQGETITLDASLKRSKYKWQDGSTEPQYNITKPGIYWVEVSNSKGTSVDSVVVSHGHCPDDAPIPRAEYWKYQQNGKL